MADLHPYRRRSGPSSISERPWIGLTQTNPSTIHYNTPFLAFPTMAKPQTWGFISEPDHGIVVVLVVPDHGQSVGPLLAGTDHFGKAGRGGWRRLGGDPDPLCGLVDVSVPLPLAGIRRGRGRGIDHRRDITVGDATDTLGALAGYLEQPWSYRRIHRGS